jgi:hypothetical protein
MKQSTVSSALIISAYINIHTYGQIKVLYQYKYDYTRTTAIPDKGM